MKSGNIVRKNVISNMIDAIQKASITNKGRIEITEKLVDETLIKYQKSVQEQVDTCPVERTELKMQYENELTIVKEYAPQLITDVNIIKDMIAEILTNEDLPMLKSNRGKIMKIIMPAVKDKADSAIVNKIIGEMLV